MVQGGRADEYAWLRDRNIPETIAYLEAENAYTAAVMEPLAAIEEQLYQEIRGRVKETDVSVPAERGGWLYYTRTEAGKQYSIHCRRRAGPAETEEILLDGNQLAEGHDYFSLGALEPSPDQNLVAYTVDVSGDEVYTGRFLDLRTRELLADAVTGAAAPIHWANDNRTCFYLTLDDTLRPYRLYRHRLGASEDELLYEEEDERFELEVLRSRSGAYVFLESASNITSEYRYLSADNPDDEFRVLLPRRQGVEYDLAHHGRHFYVRINDQGRNFRLLRMDLDGAMEEVRPHREEVLLEGVQAFRDHLVLAEREDGLRQIAIEKLATGEQHRVEFPEPVYAVWPMDNLEFDTARLRLGYTSLVTPFSVYDYDMDARTRELRKQSEVVGGYDAASYATERIFAEAADGARVPISLVYRKGLVRDGHSPALLYGYGAYGASTEPSFSSDRLSLLNRGFVYAIGHIRGGEEMGRGWYEDGRLLHKRNTFTDFIACAERLVAGGYTSSDRLAVVGGSAGGLLIGAALNLHPELFHAAIAKVPFVDALNTMLDPTLPLTAIEYEEWGNPEEPTYYDYILSYSPYDNVEAATYPHLLITGGLNDPRVGFWEPAKWAARLRARETGDRLLLLKTNLGAGHFGPSGRYRKFHETAFEYAFLAKVGIY